MDELWMRYGRIDTKVRTDFTENKNSFDFSVAY